MRTNKLLKKQEHEDAARNGSGKSGKLISYRGNCHNLLLVSLSAQFDGKTARNKVSMKFPRSSDVVKRRTCSRTCPKIRIYISANPASWKIEFPSGDRFCALPTVLIPVDVSDSPWLRAYCCSSNIIRVPPCRSYATTRRVASRRGVQMAGRLIKYRGIGDARATNREDSRSSPGQSIGQPNGLTSRAISLVHCFSFETPSTLRASPLLFHRENPVLAK